MVDEAHYISQWGHDFGPRTGASRRSFETCPGRTVLATTATTEEIVVDDVSEELGEHIGVRLGPLGRETLELVAGADMSYAERLAWLAEQVSRTEGNDIIPRSTQRDVELIAAWLVDQNIDARLYHDGLKEFEREPLEQLLVDNGVKSLVASSALGMGFDEPDLAFVYHMQTPPSITEYYQQVGRAGRSGQTARGVLLSGPEDHRIVEYFHHSALPPEPQVSAVLDALNAKSSLSKRDLIAEVNLRETRIDHVLEFLRKLHTVPDRA